MLILGVEFSTAAGPPKNFRYQLWYNASLSSNSSIFGNQILAVVRGLDEAIITYANDPSATTTTSLLDITLKDWPKVPPTVFADDIVAQFGAMFFFCTEMVIFMSVLNMIVSEKEAGLREMMEQMGLSPGIYWLSWLINYSAVVVIASVLICLFGMAFGFEVFSNSNFAVLSNTNSNLAGYIYHFFVVWNFDGGICVLYHCIFTTIATSRYPLLPFPVIVLTRLLFVGIFFLIIGLLFQSFVFSNSFIGLIWWDKSTDKAGWLSSCFY